MASFKTPFGRRSAPLLTLALAALAFFASPAARAQAYTDSALLLRLGPGPEWSIVAELPPSTYVRVLGCDPRYQWCQVHVPHGLQGWLPGEGLRDVRDDLPLRRDIQGIWIDFPVIVFTGIHFGHPIVPGPIVRPPHDDRRVMPRPPRNDSPRNDSPRNSDRQDDRGAKGSSEREPTFPGRGGPR